MIATATKVLLALTLMATGISLALRRGLIAPSLNLLIAIAAFGGLILAIHEYRPRRSTLANVLHPDPWLLLGFGFVLRQLADFSQHASGTFSSPPSGVVQWALIVASTLCAGYGMAQMIHYRYGERARDHLFEALILAGTCSMIAWVMLFEPLAERNGMSIDRFLPVAFELGMLLVLASQAAHIATSLDRRVPAFTYLCVGTVLPVLACIFEAVAAANSFSALSNASAALQPLSIGFVGIGALDQSMTYFEEPSGPAGARLNKWRFANLLAPVVLGPLFLVLTLTHRLVVSPLVISIYTIGLSVFVVSHLLAMVQARASSTHWASHDKLTGLPNRALFRERTSQSLERARKSGEAIAVMYLDLDRFKHINDSMGHAVGDQLLEQVAKRILTCVDPSDTVARLGGDEFAVLLPTIENDRVPRMVARRLLKAFSSPFNLKPRPVFMSPSIGIAMSEGSVGLEAILTQADTAMYRAKESGRNNFAVWTHEMNEASHQRLLLETHLHSAIANDELRLVYQPQVNLSTGKIIGVEALIRWHHPKLGVISPAVFIHLAEESGLINQIGEWVLITACKQACKWFDAGYSNLTMAVNLSSRQFQNENVADLVARTLRDTKMDPRYLELELTESLAMSGDETTVNTLLDIRSMGVTTTIDDFGTGYSNLSYLSRFPIDKLKIDRAFIELIDKSGGDAAIVVAIIAMAHGLGLTVIAEGVETPEQAEFLAMHDCDEMQGYLFSKPLPPEDIERLFVLENASSGQNRPARFRMPPPGRSREFHDKYVNNDGATSEIDTMLVQQSAQRFQRDVPGRERTTPQSQVPTRGNHGRPPTPLHNFLGDDPSAPLARNSANPRASHYREPEDEDAREYNEKPQWP